ncbi:MAG TPA: hypothetical protein VK501_18080 [Baekduia sp.]|uniref:hypothetical protein n=1 Tax=Baekduia sp. TaxID=2600305 RepID=UPI002B9749DB|nr:hypothetical protein [Baekduia sp.]HMJ35818.1 hypothetical protein [Baekduia sp.]
MARREQAPETLAAFGVVLDELAVHAGVERAVWFGAPAAKVEGKIFLAVFDGTLVARVGAEECDDRVLSGHGERFDPSGKGRSMKDWLQTSLEPADWPELAQAALAFSAPRYP